MEFTLTPSAGYQFTVSSIVVKWQRSGTGNTQIALRSSVDSYASDLESVKNATDSTTTQTFTWTFAQAASSSPVIYRFYSYAESTSGSGGPGDAAGNDIVVNGTVTAIPPPTITPTPTSLGNFTTSINTPSAAQSLTVTGASLTANITATAPSGFEVSSDNSSYSGTASIPQTDGSASAPLFVRLASRPGTASLSGNLTLSSEGAANATVALSGEVLEPPVFQINTFHATVGVPFTGTINATNSPSSYTSETLPAGLTLDSTNGNISGTPVAAGNFTVNATAKIFDVSGNGTLSFNIAKGTQTINGLAATDSKFLGDAPYSLNAAINSGLPISFSSSNTSVATVASDGTVTIEGIGLTTLAASQAGDENWNPAANATQTLAVTPPPTINVSPDSLTGFSTKENAASDSQTVTVNGTDFMEALAVTAPVGYEISKDGTNYSQTLTITPNVAIPLTEPLVIGSDAASNYGTPDSSTWVDGADGGTGFGAWAFTIDSYAPTYYAGAFIGDPAAASITGFPSPAFGLYANPGGTPAAATVSRSLDLPMRVGDSFSFQWATNWDSDVGNKGFNIFAGGVEVVNVNQGGFPGDITLNGKVAIDGASGYGSGPMTWTIKRDSETNLLVTSTARNGSPTVVFTGNVTIPAAPDGFSFYTSAMGQGDQRQPYFNNLQLITTTAPGGNLTNTTVFVRLAANGTPGAAEGNLTLTSANATTRTVTLSGTVIELTEPVITSRTINGTVGIALNEPIGAENSPTSHTANGTIPPGVSFNATTGVFSGTPTTAGNYTLAVTATNADGMGTGNLTFAIAKGNPTVTPPVASSIFSGQTLANSILSGGSASINGTFAFTYPSIAPPVGNSTQSVTFTPADSLNWNSVSFNVSVSVSPEPPGPPGFSSTPLAATVGVPLSITANISNGPTSYSGNLPDGLTLDLLTGLITGTPYAAGNFSVPVTATNIKGATSGNLIFQIAKGTPSLVTPPQVLLYSDETLADTTPVGGLADIAGEFVFANPALRPTDGQSVGLIFTPYDAANWNSANFTVNAEVVALPVYGLTISRSLPEIAEGDPYSETRIRITHNGTTSRAVTVNFTASPSALQGDMSGNLTFVNFPASATIPVGSNSTAFYVRAINDQTYTGNRTVTLTGTGRFLGSNAFPVTLTVLEDDPLLTGFAAWSNNASRTPELIRDYAIGGAAMGQRGQSPTAIPSDTHATLSARVRTNDPSLKFYGEWTNDLRNGTWTPVLLQTPSHPSGFDQLLFSIPRENGETKKFLRLRVELQE